MLRFDDIVFGPIHSRRLGSSLGVNLLPRDGKLCNFDCIYCECGWNRNGRDGDRTLPDASEVEKALESKLTQCLKDGTPIDSITFSGNGEPTLNPDFPEIIGRVLSLRDKMFPDAKVSVLSNATMIGCKEIREALMKVDNPILKLDGPDEIAVRAMNRPCGKWSLEATLDAMKQFNGRFVLQTMFLKGADFDFMEGDALERWMDMVRMLSPREIMIYTLDRQAPMAGLQKYTVQQMQALVQPLIDDGFKIMIRG